jgi:hypothetical protein
MAIIKPGALNPRNKNPVKVNAKTEAFLQRYAANGRDVNEAEEWAGYAPNYGRTILAKENARERLAEIMQVSADALGVYQKQVLEEVAALAFSDVSETVDIETPEDLKALPWQVRHSIQRIEWDTKIVYRGTGNKKRAITQRFVKRIHMYPKQKNLEILALATRLIDNLRTGDAEEKPQFTGFDVIAADGTKKD